jgi:dienelactone hydrolase
MRFPALVGVWSGLLFAPTLSAAEPAPAEKGIVHFQPVGDQQNIPERYRLGPHDFDYQTALKADLPTSGIKIFRVQYPSPVQSPYPENNTVHGEYYRPNGEGPFPGVVVLDVIGGADQIVSRSLSTQLARGGVAALFIQMPYYGPRRPPGKNIRMISPDYRHSIEAVRQTVLDARRAVAWLEAQPEIDATRLGIMGTSLGSFMGSLTAEMEPKVRRVAILLGGGGLVDAYYDDSRARTYRIAWELLGGTKEKLAQLLAPVDPLTYAANLCDRKVLMLAGKRDEVVLPKMTEALWKASGMQKLVWFDCTHVGAAVYIVPAIQLLVDHFKAE